MHHVRDSVEDRISYCLHWCSVRHGANHVGESLISLTKAQLGGITVGLRDLAAQTLLFK